MKDADFWKQMRQIEHGIIMYVIFGLVLYVFAYILAGIS